MAKKKAKQPNKGMRGPKLSRRPDKARDQAESDAEKFRLLRDNMQRGLQP